MVAYQDDLSGAQNGNEDFRYRSASSLIDNGYVELQLVNAALVGGHLPQQHQALDFLSLTGGTGPSANFIRALSFVTLLFLLLLSLDVVDPADDLGTSKNY